MNYPWMKDDDIPEGWGQTFKVFLQPFQMSGSGVFVQNVMRKIRLYDQKTEKARWAVFVRWAIPALALSFTGFTAALALTVQPADLSTEALLVEGRDQNISTEWVANPPNEDQIFDSVVAKP